MWFLYLDESGDLGFDFVNKKPSKYFVVSILAVKGQEDNLKIQNAIKKTLARKLNYKKRKRTKPELKANSTIIGIKHYFYERVRGVKFTLYAVVLNKRRVFEQLTRDKSRVYNWIARQVLDSIPFEKVDTRIILIVDKSKSKPEIADFNGYVLRQLEGRINPKVPLDIHHWDSKENAGLQAVDLFCWGVFQKYERNRMEWYSIFQEKIAFETRYL